MPADTLEELTNLDQACGRYDESYNPMIKPTDLDQKKYAELSDAFIGKCEELNLNTDQILVGLSNLIFSVLATTDNSVVDIEN